MTINHWWNNAEGNTEVFGERPIPVPLGLPKFSHGLYQNQART